MFLMYTIRAALRQRPTRPAVYRYPRSCAK